MSAPRPPETGSTHPLPFEKLSPDAFERLCYALVEREGYEDVEHVGASGQDEGCDIVAVRKGERVVFQFFQLPGENRLNLKRYLNRRVVTTDNRDAIRSDLGSWTTSPPEASPRRRATVSLLLPSPAVGRR
ncbi:MAG TPA: restriction endonuclease [Thermoanaerobaculia bacterium]|nr:restriction endonuclease [Thermoanaerobaculia bacterium]